MAGPGAGGGRRARSAASPTFWRTSWPSRWWRAPSASASPCWPGHDALGQDAGSVRLEPGRRRAHGVERGTGPFGVRRTRRERRLARAKRVGTHIALALRRRAVMLGYKARFMIAAALMMQLAAAKAQGRPKECFNRAVLGPKLLVIDEISYQPFGRDEATCSSRWWPSATSAAQWSHEQRAVHAVGECLRRGPDADGGAAESPAAPRLYRADHRGELPIEGQAQGRPSDKEDLVGDLNGAAHRE